MDFDLSCSLHMSKDGCRKIPVKLSDPAIVFTQDNVSLK